MGPPLPPSRDVLDGRRHQLPPTEPERHNAIHGLARRELSCLEPGRSFTSSWGITSEGAGR